MGFHLGGKKKSSGTSVASRSLASSTEGNKSTDSSGNHHKLLKKGQKLFQKVIPSKTFHSTTSTSKNYPATPSHLAPTATTPATTLLQNDPTTSLVKQQQQPHHQQQPPFYHQTHASVSSQAVEVPYDATTANGNHDNHLSNAILEERERIRQQLFYEEEGVEVTAQFRQDGGPLPAPTANTNTNTNTNTHRQPTTTSTVARRRQEEEKKEEDAPASPPAKSSKYKEDSLPPTPELDPSEADPVARFPAVQAAILASKKAPPATLPQPQQQQQPQPASSTMNIELVASSNASAQMASIASSRTSTRYYTAAQPTPTQVAATVVPVSPSPEKPFDEPRSTPSEKPFDEIPNNMVSKDDDTVWIISKVTGIIGYTPLALKFMKKLDLHQLCWQTT